VFYGALYLLINTMADLTKIRLFTNLTIKEYCS